MMIRSVGRTITTLGLAIGLALAAGAGTASAQTRVGEKAPPFSLKGTDGKTYSLDQFKGKSAVVLAWFPKADTPGCTTECKSIRASSKELRELNVAYFTISVDKPEDNKKFAEKYDLDYPILSDPDKTVAGAYGVLLGSRPYAARWTFYIDKDGIIKEVDRSVKVDQAGSDIAAKVKALGLASK
jgi:peroxiredoxin Q/BCP